MKSRFGWILGCFFVVTNLAADPASSVEGFLRERGTRTPLADVSVFILPHKLKAVTDGTGHFHFDNVPDGAFQWVVNLTGYRRLEKNDVVSADESRARVLYLERDSYQKYETTVVGKLDKRDDTQQTLKAAEFLQMPGAGGDPLKAVQNLPGVNRPDPMSSNVIIQGSAPESTKYTIDGHEVPIIFHFGGLSSVVFPEALDRVDYLSAGYGPEYGRVTGGLVGVWTRAPNKKAFHGLGFLDVFNAGLLLETPVGEKGSLLFAARQSYVGAVLKAVLAGNKDFNLTVAPSFADVLAVYDTEFSEKDKFRLTTIGSQDKLEFLFAEPVGQDPSIRGTFSNRTSFFRFIPQYEHRFDEKSVARLSLGVGKDWTHFDIGDKYFDLQSIQLTTRGEYERKWDERWTSQFGIDNSIIFAHVNLLLPTVYEQGGVYNPISTGEVKRVDVDNNYQLLGAYWRNEIKLGDTPWTLLPSLRGEYYSSTHQAFALPRLTVRYQLSDSVSLRTGGGLYAQPPLPQQVDSIYGNPDVKAERAWHWFAAADKDFRAGGTDGVMLTGTLFYKNLLNLVVNSSSYTTRNGAQVPEYYNNSGSGKAYGATLLTKFNYQFLLGFLSYTLSKSVRSLPGTDDYFFDYDQTHIITAVISADAGKNWRLSTRARYATGNPITPISGTYYDSDNDVFLPVRGLLNGDRLEPFFQLDFRVDKRWIFETWILSAYLDIQNITNRKNTEDIRYAYDYSTTTKVSGLPILPTLGVKAEF